MVEITAGKVIIIVVATAIVIVLAYVFRFGRFSRKKQGQATPEDGRESPPDPR